MSMTGLEPGYLVLQCQCSSNGATRNQLIIHVTVPFENGQPAFENARKLKLDKYDQLSKELSVNGKTAVVEPIVVGAHGSWDQVNENVFKKICARNYGKLVKKIIISKPIAYSCDIYAEHVGWIPQDFEGHQV